MCTSRRLYGLQACATMENIKSAPPGKFMVSMPVPLWHLKVSCVSGAYLASMHHDIMVTKIKYWQTFPKGPSPHTRSWMCHSHALVCFFSMSLQGVIPMCFCSGAKHTGHCSHAPSWQCFIVTLEIKGVASIPSFTGTCIKGCTGHPWRYPHLLGHRVQLDYSMLLILDNQC